MLALGPNEYAGIAFSVLAAGLPTAAPAQTLSAGVVMQKMSADQRAMYLAGIVEGLAHARFARDNKDPAGRSCIYRWFYDEQDTQRKIVEAFARYPDALPGQIVGTLAATRCGA